MSNLLRILYVEDEVMLNELTTELLVAEGFLCVSVLNGEDACRELEKKPFDLLLTDFQMPKMNGAELLFWCRRKNFHLPVIFLSGNIEAVPQAALALTDCCTSLLRKPIAFQDLLEAIKKSTTRKHEFNCLTNEEAKFPGQHVEAKNS